MKTLVLQLDRHDDVASVTDKMNWGKSERVLLVWPHWRGVLDRKLDLVLIDRYSRQIGARIAVVSRKAEVVQAAEAQGIPIFRSVREAQRVPWEAAVEEGVSSLPARPSRKFNVDQIRFALTRPKDASINLGANRRIWFGLGIAAVISIALIFIPSATIALDPVNQIQTLDLTLSADPGLKAPTVSGGVPAEIIRITVEGRDSLRPSGSVSIPQSPARGEVVFTNLTDRAITIPSGTVVRTRDGSSIAFQTLEAASLPAEPGASISLPVEAQNPGSAGNLPMNSLTVIVGDLGLSLAANNPSATSGGTERVSGAPSENDYTKLELGLMTDLWQSVLTETSGLLERGDYIINIDPGNFEVIRSEFTPTQPQPANTLDLHLQVQFELLLVRADALEATAALILDTNRGPGLAPLPESLLVIPAGEPMFTETGAANWPVSLQRTLTSAVDTGGLTTIVTGLTIPKAEEHIQALLTVKDIQITTSPGWWPWLPWLPFRITVVMQ